jgi:hypothetical protein
MHLETNEYDQGDVDLALACDICKVVFTECPECQGLSLFSCDGFVGEAMEICEKCTYSYSEDPRPYIV